MIQPINGPKKLLYITIGRRLDETEIYIIIIILKTVVHLDLKKCLYVPEYHRNLVSMCKLDVISFNFMVGDNMCSLDKDKYCYGSSIFVDRLYHFNLDDVFSLTHVSC